jgi:hypothetical protein
MVAQNASTEAEPMQENTNMSWTKQRSLLSFRFLLVHTPNMEVHLALLLLVLIVTGMIKDVILARMLWRFLKKMQKKLHRKPRGRMRRQILDPQGASKQPKLSLQRLLDRKIKLKRRKKRKKSQKWSKKLFHKIDNVQVATDTSAHLQSKRNMDSANSIRSLVK